MTARIWSIQCEIVAWFINWTCWTGNGHGSQVAAVRYVHYFNSVPKIIFSIGNIQGERGVPRNADCSLKW